MFAIQRALKKWGLGKEKFVIDVFKFYYGGSVRNLQNRIWLIMKNIVLKIVIQILTKVEK